MQEGYDSMGHEDSAQDQSQIDSNLSQFVQELVPILENLSQKVSYLEDRLENQLIGGLQREYQNKAKSEAIGGYRQRHGERLDPLVQSLAEAHGDNPDSFWDAMHGKMSELGVGEDQEGSFMDQVHGHLMSTKEKMLQALQGSPAAMSSNVGSGEAPAAVVKMEAMGEPEAVKVGAKKAAEAVNKGVEKKSEPAVGSEEFFKNARQKGQKPSPKARK
jgi:hypothetical protein